MLPLALTAQLNPQGRPKIYTLHKEHRVREVGNKRYFRPPAETFHEFILNLFRWTLGKDWYFSELKKRPEDQHQIMRWFQALKTWKKVSATEENRVEGGWAVYPSGEAQSLISLAYDIYHLLHTCNLSQATVARLKTRDWFQGARYELAVAAIFARLGFKLEYPPEGLQQKHVEFVARHGTTGARISVEAKSRHRSGVLHQRGELDLKVAARGDVQVQFERALQQCPGDMPFAIFVDLNAPPTPGAPAFNKPWFKDVMRMMEKFGSPTPDNPDEFNALFLTNFSYHYYGERQSPAGEMLSIMSHYPKYAFPPALMSAIFAAVRNYGQIPDEIY